MLTPRRASAATKTILLLDDDLGFLLTLGELLVDAGHRAFPAVNRQCALELAERLEWQIDLLVVHPGLPDAAMVIETLSRHTSARIVAITGGPGTPRLSTPPIHGSIRRLSPGQAMMPCDWVRTIEQVLGEAHLAPAGAPQLPSVRP